MRRRRGHWAWLLRAACCLASAGCSALPDLDFDQCGNGLVEPEAGEDCDSREAPELGDDLRCGAADTPRACRYVCDGATCPQGWICGADEVCRRPARRFSAASSLDLDASRLVVGDLDGDEVPDVVVHPERRLTAALSDGAGGFFATVPADVGRGLGRPVIAPVRGPPEILVPLAAGIHRLRVTDGPGLEGVAHSPFDLSELTGGRGLVVPVARAGIVQDELLTVFDGPGGLTITVLDQQDVRLVLPGLRAADLSTGALALADLEGLEPPLRSEELVLATRGSTTAHVIGFGCAGAPPGGLCPDEDLRLERKATVELGGRLSSGLHFADVDGDGRVDVLAEVRVAARRRIVWAKGAAAGFSPAIEDPRIAQACGPGCVNVWPILAGDLNEDGAADFVLPQGILHTVDVGEGELPPLGFAYSPFGGRIDEAAAADFNRDGRTDVALHVDGVDGVELLLGGPRFVYSSFFERTPPSPRKLTAGDFDGDLVDDLALVVNEAGGSRVFVLFGSTQGPFRPAASMGRFDFVQRLRAGYVLSSDIGEVDARADLLLQTTEDPEGTGPLSSAVLIGTADRQMLAPYVLGEELEFELPWAVAVGAFDDGHPGLDLLALTDRATWVVASGEADTFGAGDGRRFELTCARGGWPLPTVLTPSKDGTRAHAITNAVGGGAQLRTLTPRAGQAPACDVRDLPATLRGPSAPVWADLPPDGAAALVIPFRGDVRGGGGLAILRPAADGFDPAPEVVFAPEPSLGVFGVAAGHVDDDGERELFVATDAGVFVLDYAEGAWRFDDAPLALGLEAGELPRALAAADLNQDGLPDLLVGTERRLLVALAVERRVGELAP